MKTLAAIKQWLAQHKPLLDQRYGVQAIGIFGSYVRLEQTEASDIDVLVEYLDAASATDVAILGRTIQEDIPELKKMISEVLQNMWKA